MRSIVTRRGTLVALALLTVSCSSRDGSQAPDAPPALTAASPSSIDVRWVPLRAPHTVSFLELPATVLPAAGHSAAMNPPYPGQIMRVHVQAGQKVKRGQPVVDIMMPAVAAAAGEQAAAGTKIQAYLARLQQLKTLKAEGLVRAADVSDVEMRVAEARADARRAGSILRSAGVDPGRGEHLSDSGGIVTLRSPIDGMVTEVSVALGENRDNAGPPFVRIAGIALARIEARAVERFPKGVRFEVLTAGGERIAVHLVAEAPVVDSRDGTTAAWFEPESDRSLPAGMSLKLRVVVPDGPGLTIAPRSAVGSSASGTFVRMRGANGSTDVPVKVQLSSGADALIESPLAAGTEVAERVAEPAP